MLHHFSRDLHHYFADNFQVLKTEKIGNERIFVGGDRWFLADWFLADWFARRGGRSIGNAWCRVFLPRCLGGRGLPCSFFLFSLSSLLFENKKNRSQARNPSFSPFFFARRIRPCTCFVSTPIDLPNSLMTGVFRFCCCCFFEGSGVAW